MGYKKKGDQGLLLFNYLPLPIPGNSAPAFGGGVMVFCLDDYQFPSSANGFCKITK